MRELSPREKIAKARIILLTDYPFFGSIAMHLIPRELSKEEAEKYGIKTMGVDEYGNLPYNREWVEQQDQETLRFVVCHEIMHVCLRHLQRKGSREMFKWNYATDAAINDILGKTFRVPQGLVLIPEMSGKSAEEIYDWLVRNAKVVKVPPGYLFDTHIYGGKPSDSGGGGQKEQGQEAGGVEQGSSPFKREGQEPLDVSRIVREAYNYARNQGNVPLGMERLFSNLLNPVMNWKDILRKYIVSVVPHDFTYTYPSKKTYSTGFYMPKVLREFVDIVIAVDSSGSIRDDEYAEFLSEIYGMVRQFENLRATLLVCDCEIQTVEEIDQSFDPYSITGRGYGGTSSLPVYKWIEDNKNNNVKLLVYFSDGWIDVPQDEKPFHTLWIITPEGDTRTVEKQANATVIKMPSRRGRD